MIRIITSEDASLDLERIFVFLDEYDKDLAKRALEAINEAISHLLKFPEAFPIVDDEFRIITVPFGRKGYSIAYIYDSDHQEVVIYGIKHQTEEFFPFELSREDGERQADG